MRVVKKSGLLALSSLFIIGGLAAFGSKAYADVYPDVNKDLGITYLKDTNGVISGYDFHANDVIIKTVSKEGTTYYNFYLDKNANGVVDGDEAPAILKKPDDSNKETDEDTTDLPIIYSVYGANKVKVDEAYTITIDNVSIDNTSAYINGAYDSELHAPFTMNVKDTTYKGDGQIAAFVHCTDNTDDTDDTAVHLSVSGKTDIYSIYAITGASTVTGKVDLKIDADDIGVEASGDPELPGTPIKSSVSRIYLLSQGSTMTGDAVLDVKNVNADYLYSVTDGGKLSGSLDVSISDSKVTSNMYFVIYGSSVGSNADISIKDTVLPYNCYCISQGSSVGGNLTINLDGVQGNYFYGIDTCSVGGDYNLSVNKSDLYKLYGTNGSNSTAGSVGKNATITFTESEIGSMYGISDTKVEGNVIITSDKKSEFAFNDYCFAVYSYNNYSNIGGDLTVDIHNASESTSLNYISGMTAGRVVGSYTCNISGNFGGAYGIGGYYSSQIARIEKDVTITIKDVIEPSSRSYICGIYGNSTSYRASIGGNIDVLIQNADTKNSYSIYGLYNVYSGGETTKVTIDNSKANSIYGIYNGVCGKDKDSKSEIILTDNTTSSSIEGIYGSSSSSHFFGDIDVTMSGNTNTGTNEFYGAYGSSDSELCSGNLNVVMSDNETSGNMIALYSGVVSGDVTVTATDNVMKDSGYFYKFAVSEYSTILGSLTGTVKDCTFKHFHGAYSVVKGKTNIDVTNTYVYGYEVYPYQSNNSSAECGDVTISFNNVTFANVLGYDDKPEKTNIYTRAATKQNVYVYFDDTTVLPDMVEWDQSVGNQENSSVVCEVRDEDIFVCGNYDLTDEHLKDFTNVHWLSITRELDKNVTYNNLEMKYCRLVIPEGITLKAANFFTMNDCYLCIEGTVDAEFTDYSDEQIVELGRTKAESNWIYMNGGSYPKVPDKANILYPFSYSFNDYGGAVDIISDSIKEFSLRPDITFVKVQDSVKLRAYPEDGFEIKNATLTINGVETNMVEDKTATYTDYSFDMGEGPAVVEIEFIGGKISMGKTCYDPVAIVNQNYTEASPLYDFNSLQISYDANKGDIKAELADGASLPSGLQLTSSGKLIGKITSKDTDGKRVKFRVTSRNGVTENIYLVIKSKNSGETLEPSCEGMVTIDETDKIINLHGNSVYVEASGDETAIYIDENRDGVKDLSTPAVVGDYSAYKVYGIEGGTTEKAVSIVMNGGSFAGYKALYKSTQTLENASLDGINIVIAAGNAGTINALYDSTTNAEVYVLLNETTGGSVVMTAGKSTNLSMQGYLETIAGEATIMGAYHMKGNADFNNLSLVRKDTSNYSVVYAVIPKNVKLNVLNTISLGDYSGLMVRGELKAVTRSYYNSSRLVVAEGGSVDITNNTNTIYYPLTYISDLDQSVLTPSGYLEIAVGNEPKQRYVASGSDMGYSLSQYAGYTVSYRVNDGDIKSLEPTNGSSVSFAYTNPNGPVKVESFYSPTQIEIINRFSEARCTLNKTYTASLPVFDYTMLPITNDCLKAYGRNENITYEIADGQLPEGLVLENGKVYGTPTRTGSGKVDVKITGYNGSSAVVSVEYAVDSDFVGEDINSLISLSSNALDLNGNSVVILTDPDNPSKVNIFLDQNHDGLADNTNAFLYGGSKAIDLNSCTVYGYRNSAALNKDLSIYVYGGNFGGVYGVYGDLSTAVVNGDVTVNISGGRFTNNVVGVYNAKADTVTMDISGGSYSGTRTINVRGAYNPVDVGTVNFSFTGKAVFSYTSQYNYTDHFVAATQGGNVTGDVNVTVGADSNSSNSGFDGSYSSFLGIKNTQVAGNVNYQIAGNFISVLQMYMISGESTVSGDLNVDWQKGSFSATNYNSLCKALVRDSSVRDIIVNISGKPGYSYAMYPSSSATVRNIIWEAPNAGSGMQTSLDNGYMNLSGYGYMLNGNKLEIMGEYTLAKDFSGSDIIVHHGGKLTIPEGINVSVTNGIKIGGEIDNKGVIECGGTINVGDASNSGKLSNSGTINTMSRTSCTVYVGVSGSADSEIINEGDINVSVIKIYGKVENKLSGNIVLVGDASTLYTGSSVDNAGTIRFNVQVITYGSIKNSGLMIFNYPYYNYNGLLIFAAGRLSNLAGGELEINSVVSNSGKIYNFGKLTQKYKNSSLSGNLGTVFNAGELILALNTNSYSSSKIYYPVETDYPEIAFEGMSVADTTTSGFEGDNNLYARAGSTIKATLKAPKTGYTFDSVETITINDEPMTASSVDNDIYSGKMPYDKAYVSVRMKVDDGKQIVLSPSEKTVSGLKVGAMMNSIDLKSAITITDDDENGTVKYAVSSSDPLPKGLTLSDGVISGKPEKASAAAQVSKIIITGKNLSRAVLTLTFDAVEKGVPVFTIPNISGSTGMTLAQVTLPYSQLGTYSWSDNEALDEVIDQRAIDGEDFEMLFSPDDLDNYDWSKAGVGVWNDNDKVLEFKVKIGLNVINPIYPESSEATAVYGQKLSDITVEVGEGYTPGHFEWREPDTVLEKLGEYTYYANYVPDDLSRYKKVTYVPVTVTVKKTEKTAPLFETFNASNGDTLSDVTLPTVEEGKYVWIDSYSAKVYKDKKYRIVFKPNDVANIKWLVPAGFPKAYFSDSYGGVVFEVTATGDDLIDEPTVQPTEAPTEKPTEAPTTAPSEVPTTVPSIVPTEVPTDAPVQPTATPVQPTATPTPGAAPGTRLTPAGSKDGFMAVDASFFEEGEEFAEGEYIEGPYAIYTGPANKKVKSVKIPDTITVDGVTYKIIGIGDKALSKCKKLTKVTIGKNVRFIGKDAFKGCVKLKKITIPASVKSVRSGAFSGCKAIQTVTFAKGSKLYSIGKNAFLNCKSLKSMKITSTSLEKIGKAAFKNAGKKSYKKFKISVPKAKKKDYKKLLKKGGLNKKVKVK